MEPLQTPETDDSPRPDERVMLLQRARLMGLTVSPNIGLDKLKERINAHIASEAPEVLSPEEPDLAPLADPSGKPNSPAAPVAMVPPRKRKETFRETRDRLMKECMQLIRCRITCMNPAKRDLTGEIYTVANEYIGSVKKFVPYKGFENGYHLPKILYEMLKDRKFTQIDTKAGPRGRESITTRDVPEFAIEVLPQLTKQELRRLALQQQAEAGQTTE